MEPRIRNSIYVAGTINLKCWLLHNALNQCCVHNTVWNFKKNINSIYGQRILELSLWYNFGKIYLNLHIIINHRFYTPIRKQYIVYFKRFYVQFKTLFISVMYPFFFCNVDYYDKNNFCSWYFINETFLLQFLLSCN